MTGNIEEIALITKTSLLRKVLYPEPGIAYHIAFLVITLEG